MHIITVPHSRVNEKGVVPFVWQDVEGQPLFIIEGGIRGGVRPVVYGTVHKYQSFPWPKGEEISEEQCRAIARDNVKASSRLCVDGKVFAQFCKIYPLEIQRIKLDTEYLSS